MRVLKEKGLGKRKLALVFNFKIYTGLYVPNNVEVFVQVSYPEPYQNSPSRSYHWNRKKYTPFIFIKKR